MRKPQTGKPQGKKELKELREEQQTMPEIHNDGPKLKAEANKIEKYEKIETTKTETGAETETVTVKIEAVPAEPVEPAKRSLADIEAELKLLEIEEKKLAISMNRANLEDMKERLGERELKRETVRQRSITNGSTLKQLAANDKATQTRCNHRKGGNGVNGILGGQGDDQQYAIFKHTFCNGDTWVRCLRCGKTWKPPVPSLYDSAAALAFAQVDYQNALQFTTRNIPSASVMFKFSDGGAHYREVTKDVSLR